MAEARLVLRGGRWHLEGEPYVLQLVRRVFGRAAGEDGPVILARSTSNEATLAWILIRYPAAMSVQDRRSLEAGAKAHAQRLASLPHRGGGGGRLLDFPLMALPPRPYQREAASLWVGLGRLLLADDMGLGKTITALAGISRGAPAVVVTDTHLPAQGAREAARFVPTLKVHILKGTKPYPLPRCDLILTSYSKLTGWAETLSKWAQAVVFDEVQELRHDETAKYEAAQRLTAPARFVLGLSATPIHNFGGEFFNILNLLNPGFLGNKEEFLKTWCLPSEGAPGKYRLENPALFGSYLRNEGLMVRRTRADVGRELPPIEAIPYPIAYDASAFARETVDARGLAEVVLRGEGRERQQAAFKLDKLMRRATGIAKVHYLAALISLLVEQGERPVVFLWHLEVYSRLMALLRPYRPVQVTGEETPPQKETSVKAYVEGESSVLLMSLRAGRGLDGLQHCSRCVVIGELDWCEVVHQQCIGRVARDGQTSPVAVYLPLADVGTDPLVYRVACEKAGNMQPVLDLDTPAPPPTPALDPLGELARRVLAC